MRNGVRGWAAGWARRWGGVKNETGREGEMRNTAEGRGEGVKRFREPGGRGGEKKNDKERRERVMSLPLYHGIKPVGW